MLKRTKSDDGEGGLAGGERDRPRRIGGEQDRDRQHRPEHRARACRCRSRERADEDPGRGPGQRAEDRPAGAQARSSAAPTASRARPRRRAGGRSAPAMYTATASPAAPRTLFRNQTAARGRARRLSRLAHRVVGGNPTGADLSGRRGCRSPPARSPRLACSRRKSHGFGSGSRAAVSASSSGAAGELRDSPGEGVGDGVTRRIEPLEDRAVASARQDRGARLGCDHRGDRLGVLLPGTRRAPESPARCEKGEQPVELVDQRASAASGPVGPLGRCGARGSAAERRRARRVRRPAVGDRRRSPCELGFGELGERAGGSPRVMPKRRCGALRPEQQPEPRSPRTPRPALEPPGQAGVGARIVTARMKVSSAAVPAAAK